MKSSLSQGGVVLAVAVVGICTLIRASSARAADTELGTISFPTSGPTAAQPAFLTGVKSLYNFEFDQAAEEFQAAEKAAPNFALAYWGEAMSYNHPLWAEQDLDTARKVLNKLASTPAARAQKAPAGKERSLVEAVDVLYGEGDKLSRDVAYSVAMERIYQKYPDDREIGVLYALSLLGTVRPGDHGFRRQMQAAAITESILRENPDHPAAAHFTIHAFDDPEHAPLGLWAARLYAKIAPAAPHALHMPSHIFVQLGMWDDVVASNVKAYAAAVSLAERMNLPRGREDFHTLSWLEYAYLQLGKFDDAKRYLEEARKTADHDTSDRVQDGYASILARYVVETERWEDMPMTGEMVHDAGVETSGMHMNYAVDGNAASQLAIGMAAAKLGNQAAAAHAEEALKTMRQHLESTPDGAYRAKPVAVMEKEVGAVIALAKHDIGTAESLLKDATALEATLDAPSGPPEPIKPSFELYGEMLLDAHRPKEAVAQFHRSLLRTPNRAHSVRGLAIADAAAAVPAH